MMSICIFVISISLSLLLLLIESLIGFDPFYHPDVYTYLTHAPDFKSLILADFFPGNFYYVISSLFDSNYFSLVIVNIIVYSLTNVFLFGFYTKQYHPNSKISLILFILFLFSPYRVHLSIVPLKDTLIIFFASIFLYKSILFRALSFLLMLSFSVRSFLYLPAFFPLRLNRTSFSVFCSLFFVFFIFYDLDLMISLISTINQVDMNFRGYDFVPAFLDLGVLGSFLRFLFWPILSLTGAYNFFSFNGFVFIVSLSPIFLQLWCFSAFRKFCFPFPIFLSLAFVAYLVPGFTSYLRYSLPLLTIAPLVFLSHNRSHIR